MSTSYWETFYTGEHPATTVDRLIAQAKLDFQLAGSTIQFVSQHESRHVEVLRTIVTGISYSPEFQGDLGDVLCLYVSAPCFKGQPLLELQFLPEGWGTTGEPGVPEWDGPGLPNFHWRARTERARWGRQDTDPELLRMITERSRPYYYGELTSC